VVKNEKALKLVCNITLETNHVTDGVKIVRSVECETDGMEADYGGCDRVWRAALKSTRTC
jgi:hypothetical protein